MTATARPRFRTDLVAEPIDDGGLRFIDVLDPDSGNGFRFFEVEYSLACAMDGERDIAGLVRWAREELGVEPTAGEVGTVISTLGELGYLEGMAPPAVAQRSVLDDGLELVHGVFAPRPQPSGYATEDVELGLAGPSTAERAAEPMPTAEDLELGIAGPGAVAHAPPVAFDASDDLGPAGAATRGAGAAAARLSAGGRDARMEFDTPTPPPPAMPSAVLRPVGGHAAEEDGPTNLPKPRTMDYEDDEVSVDLSDHLAISASDVKEAVRASKVMAAVDVPQDVLDQLEESEARGRDDAAAAQAARENARAAAAQEAAREDAAREDAARETAVREAAVQEALAREAAQESARAAAAQEALAREAAARSGRELPQIPVGVSKKKADLGKTDLSKEGKAVPPVETPPVKPVPVAQPSSARRWLVLLLLLALTIAGAYYVWTRVLKKPLPWDPEDDPVAGTTPALPPGPPVTPVQPEQPPPPPPPPVALLAEKPGEVSAIVAGQAAVLSFVIVDGSQVAVGDPVLRFAGNPADEKKLQGLEDDIERRYPKQIEDATKARDRFAKLNNASQVKVQEAKIDEVNRKREARIAERAVLQSKLDGLTIKAPIAGVVKLADRIAKGTRTTADQSVASVTAPSTLAATFTIPSGGKVYSHDASVRVSVKGTPDQKANCTVTNVDGPVAAGPTMVTVTCPADAGVAAGTDIVLE